MPSSSNTRPKLRERLRQRARQLRPWLSTLVDLFPLRGLGLLLGIGAAFALFRYGLKRADLILFLTGAASLGLLALSLLSVIVGTLIAFFSLKTQQNTSFSFECGYAKRTGTSLQPLWYLPLVNVSWRWLSPEASCKLVSRNGRLEEEVTLQQRGVYTEIKRRIEVADCFGLCAIAVRKTERVELRASPSRGALQDITLLQSFASGDDISYPTGYPQGDRIDMRRYAPGDPVRHVLWKTFAKSRVLMVRTPEQAISPSRKTLAYLVTGDNDEAAAGTARAATESGSLGSDWVLSTDGTDTEAKTKEEALSIIVNSKQQAPNDSAGKLSQFLQKHSVSGPTRVLLFVPSTEGPWLSRVTALARASQGLSPLSFVLCTDNIVKKTALPRWKQWLFATPKEETGVSREALENVLQTLRATGAGVTLVDRKQGKLFQDTGRQLPTPSPRKKPQPTPKTVERSL